MNASQQEGSDMRRGVRILALALAAATLGTPDARAQLAPSAWPMFHGAPAHTGRSAAPSLPAPALRWSALLGDTVFMSAPALGADGRIYVGAMDSSLYAVSPVGAVAWRFRAGGPLQYSSPAIASDGTVYIGGMDSTFYAVNAGGTLKWKFRAGSTVRSSPAIAADGTVYVGSGDGNLYAFDPNGATKWIRPTGNNVRSSPAIGPDGTVYVGSDDGLLYALFPATGAVRWTFALGNGVDLASPTVGPDSVIYIGTTGGLFYAVRPGGTMKWVNATGHSMYSAPAILAGGDIVITVGSDVRDLRPLDGKVQWKVAASALVRTSVAVAADGTIYAGCDNDSLLAINPGGTLKWAYAAGGPVRSSPIIGADGAVYFGCYDRRLRALQAPATGVPGGSARPALALSAPAPNPSRGGTALTFSAPQGGEGAVEVFGVDGRRVRTLYQGRVDALPRAIHWDGCDESGRTLPPGIYEVRLRVGAARLVRRAVLVR
ncbi:MAG: PQQ-binding-like beta-propeller repeat protein [Candidatus Eisenbacteria bacterium]|nr:PQQ-binding-like beta-propeller repeat protein [Candidatus Eisenbacteria bacterium]